MTTRQRLFCHHLARGTSAPKAAERAGYAPATIRQNLSVLLEAPAVARYLSRQARYADHELMWLAKAQGANNRLLDDDKTTPDRLLAAVAQTCRLATLARRAASLSVFLDTSLETGHPDSDAAPIPEYDPDPEPDTATPAAIADITSAITAPSNEKPSQTPVPQFKNAHLAAELLEAMRTPAPPEIPFKQRLQEALRKEQASKQAEKQTRKRNRR